MVVDLDLGGEIVDRWHAGARRIVEPVYGSETYLEACSRLTSSRALRAAFFFARPMAQPAVRWAVPARSVARFRSERSRRSTWTWHVPDPTHQRRA